MPVDRPTGRSDDPLDADHLLGLAISEPRAAIANAEAVLSGDPDPFSASVAHQAIGIARRDSGQLPGALESLRSALRIARRGRLTDRIIDVSATYGATLVVAGQTSRGLGLLDEAVTLSHGGLRGRTRYRRAYVRYLVGRHAEALDDLQLALRSVRRAGDGLWEAYVLNALCMVHLALGAPQQADRDAAAAIDLYVALDRPVAAAMSVQNRGVAALRQGDIPAAIRLLDEATSTMSEMGEVIPELVIDMADAYLVAGLTAEAAATATDYLATHDAIQPVKRAELLHMAAAASLAAGDAEAALAHARSAQRMFAAQQRPYWEARARFVTLQARRALGRRGKRLVHESVELAGQLRSTRSDDTPAAFLFAGRLALERGEADVAEECLAEVGRHRHRGPALGRTTGWLAVALQAEAAGDSRAVLAACRRGLDALDEHRLTFGGTELRALATGYGRDLAALALRQASKTGRARDLLWWSERWRATALTAPAIRPPDDAELARDLAALRDATRRSDEARASGQVNSPAERQRAGWEQQVRQRRLKAIGRGGVPTRLAMDQVLGTLGETAAVVLVDVDGRLEAVTVERGRVHRHQVGPVGEAVKEAEFSRFTLRGAAYGRRVGNLASMGERLQAALLGPAAASVGDGPVVIVPPARLHGVPWGLLPALAGLPLSVSPSLSIWARAREIPEPGPRRTALVLGPGLSGAESEVASLARVHSHSKVLRRGDATAEATLAALDGAWLAHIAAHGSFRSDSPLFSSLALADGPLTVHDIDRLDTPPYRMILSACEVGGGEAVGSDELLGLVTSLLGLGSAGVLASVVPVHDEASVPVMIEIHSMLAVGHTLPEAWLAARTAASGDALAAATAASFTSWGV